MARRPAPAKPIGTRLPHTWMLDGRWKIVASLAKIPPSEYLSEARRFEADALANGTLSEDWPGLWRAHCRRRLVARFEAGKPEMRCAFCDKVDPQRSIECNPEDESTQKFRWFCDSWCQARYETNQPKPGGQPATLGLFEEF